jgi:hypothetical protein
MDAKEREFQKEPEKISREVFYSLFSKATPARITRVFYLRPFAAIRGSTTSFRLVKQFPKVDAQG